MSAFEGVTKNWAANTDFGRTHIATKGIVQSGLVLNLDAGVSSSYSGSGTTWVNLANTNYSGTLTNGPTFDSSNGGNIVFDGTNDYVINTSFSNIPTNNELTISLFYKIVDNNNGRMIIDLCGNTDLGTNRDFFSIRQNWGGASNKISCYFNASTGFQYVTFPNQATIGVWYNLVYTKVNNTLLAYLNGVEVNRQNVTGNLQTIERYVVGSDNYNLAYGTTNYFNGSIASVLIYNRGLSASEISTNFNAMRGRFGI